MLIWYVYLGPVRGSIQTHVTSNQLLPLDFGPTKIPPVFPNYIKFFFLLITHVRDKLNINIYFVFDKYNINTINRYDGY